MKKRTFIRQSISGIIALSVIPPLKAINQKPALDKQEIFDFVRAGHNDLPKVESMLATTPELINASHDWGAGDFETAIEGAGHVGNTEIVEYLAESGARLNIFILAFLGKTDLIRELITAYPSIINSIGPHGFTLLHYAKMGGDKSASTQELLLSKGLSQNKI